MVVQCILAMEARTARPLGRRKHPMRKFALIAGVALCVAGAGMVHARAGDPASCRDVRMADIGWTDNEVTNALTAQILTNLGYRPDIKVLSEEVTYAGLKNKNLDFFLDDWTPSMDAISGPYVKSHAIADVGPNMTGAKYTLAVPTYLYNEGLKSFDDIAKFGKQLDYKIYGIEPGNDGNEHILKMIKGDMYGLGKFQLVQSSEQGMLSEVARKYPHKQPIVFLGWEPHPMNVQFDMSYLPGGEKLFGPNEGAAAIYTNVRSGYLEACPNVAKLLQNEKFTVDAESQMMADILLKKQKAADVAKAWMKAHPDDVKAWLAGVTTFDGQPGLPVVMKDLNG
jgi:glycine betaine/proline transport system substrate-binding protein